MRVRTCTQPSSELTAGSMGCGEVPAPISGRRRRVWGSWHLQTVHASDHCDLWRCTGPTCTQAAGQPGTCKQHTQHVFQRCTRVQCLSVVATAFDRLQVGCGVTLQHSGARNLTLGLPRCSGVACTTMRRSKTPVHSGVGTAAATSGHVPYARLVAIQPTESL